MKIIILGNIGSGKSTLAQILCKFYSDSKYISIDEIRIKFGDGTETSENVCKEKFIESIMNDNTMQVIELTGVGILGEMLFKKLSTFTSKVLVVYLHVSTEVSASRVIKRGSSKIPFPLPTSNIQNAIVYTSDTYQKGLLNSFICKCPNAFFISFNNETEEKFKINNTLLNLFISNLIDYE